MKKFRQLIRECGDGTVMYNHLHMNLLKAGLVRTRGSAGRSRSRGRGRGRGRGRVREHDAVNPAAVNPAAVNPAAVNPAAVNRQLPEETQQCNNKPSNYHTNEDMGQAIPGHPVDLVKRSNDHSGQTQVYRCLDLRQSHLENLQRDNERKPSFQPVVADTQNGTNTLNLAYQPSQIVPLPQYAHDKNNRNIPDADRTIDPVRTGFRTDVQGSCAGNICQNDRLSGECSNYAPTATRSPRPPHRSVPNVGVAFVKEIVECIFPELVYRPLMAEGREYLEVTRKEATMLPANRQGVRGTSTEMLPCHPARILVSPDGRVEFQAANKTLSTVEALSLEDRVGDSSAWRKSILECVQRLSEQSGNRFCAGLGLSSHQAQGASASRFEDIVASDFGLGFRSTSCKFWFISHQDESPLNLAISVSHKEDAITAPGQSSEFEGDKNCPDVTAVFVSDRQRTCSQCLDFLQRNLRDGRRKQRKPQKMATELTEMFNLTEHKNPL